MHNFSFGFIVATIYVVPSLWISVTENRYIKLLSNAFSVSEFSKLFIFHAIRWYKKVVWLLFHPLIVLYWITLATTIYTFKEFSAREILIKSFEALQHLIALNVTDAMIYGNWTFTVINLLLLPIWLMFWSLLNAPSPSKETGKLKQS